MAQDAQKRVQDGVTKLLADLDNALLRKMQVCKIMMLTYILYNIFFNLYLFFKLFSKKHSNVQPIVVATSQPARNKWPIVLRGVQLNFAKRKTIYPMN